MAKKRAPGAAGSPAVSIQGKRQDTHDANSAGDPRRT